MTERPIDMDALEEVARAATPGPWEAFEDHGGRETGHGYAIAGNRHRPEGHETDVLNHIGKCWGWGPTQENAAHIAAANPDTVLALIERVRVAEAKVARGKALADEAGAWDLGDVMPERMVFVDDLRAALATPTDESGQ